LAIPRPNNNGGCAYGIKLLGTLKYDRIDIQSKVFDSAYCIPTLYSLLKNCARSARTGSKPDLAIPRPNKKGGCAYGI